MQEVSDACVLEGVRRMLASEGERVWRLVTSCAMSVRVTELEAVVDAGTACPGASNATVSGGRRRQVERAFNLAVVVSGVRCTLAYVVLPFGIPFLGIAPGVGPALGLTIGLVAIFANVVSLRRFWRIRHPWRRPVTAIHIGMILFLLVMMANDIRELAA